MLTRTNADYWMTNTLIFLRPVILIYLGYVSTNIGLHGFLPAELVPNPFVAGAIVLYLVNVLTDYLRKLDNQNELAKAAEVTPVVDPIEATKDNQL